MQEIISYEAPLGTVLLILFGLLNFFVVIGLSMFQVGSIRAKNTVSLLTMNLVMVGLCSLVYLLGSQYSLANNSVSQPWHQLLVKLFALPEYLNKQNRYSLLAISFYQIAFPLIALSIIAATMAERLKLWSFILFSLIFTTIIFPLWRVCVWGQGFLYQLGFIDIAGSCSIFLLAAVSGLCGSVIMGPRLDKYEATGKSNIIFPCSLPIMIFGALLVWLGTLILNTGLHQIINESFTLQKILDAIVNSFCCGSAALIIAALTSRVVYGATDVSFTCNGLFAGLAAIAAYPYSQNYGISTLLGISCGGLIIPVSILFDKLHIDDPCGLAYAYGTGTFLGLLAVSFTSPFTMGHHLQQLLIQMCGSLLTIAWALLASGSAWLLVRFIVGLRVTEPVERLGLDIYDCATSAYTEANTRY